MIIDNWHRLAPGEKSRITITSVEATELRKSRARFYRKRIKERLSSRQRAICFVEVGLVAWTLAERLGGRGA